MLIISSNVSCSRHNIAEKMGHLSLSNTNPSLIKNNLIFTQLKSQNISNCVEFSFLFWNNLRVLFGISNFRFERTWWRLFQKRVVPH